MLKSSTVNSYERNNTFKKRFNVKLRLIIFMNSSLKYYQLKGWTWKGNLEKKKKVCVFLVYKLLRILF